MTDSGLHPHPAQLAAPATIRVHAIAEATTVTVLGELDLAITDRLAEQLTAEIELRPRALVLDLTAVTFCSSQGLGVLLSAHESAGAAGVPFAVVTEQRALLRPLQLLGLDRVLLIHAGRTEARQWLATLR
ncbi:STAS domain-containing protein [Amycolatopsis rhabdoformis]|uniref:Anti-sigma factor antagonist n=1 Tax=Amycolatopsis rhabdoformis TaxID=1448059 RepID=A0ABZ1IC78_9PSEU|nr:STAS domain-containing protein [Amycolatopsis rhabdoformis]WSE32040.1 STAS domain-containing protein [Amycolatopsis rhabdoformis]